MRGKWTLRPHAISETEHSETRTKCFSCEQTERKPVGFASCQEHLSNRGGLVIIIIINTRLQRTTFVLEIENSASFCSARLITVPQNCERKFNYGARIRALYVFKFTSVYFCSVFFFFRFATKPEQCLTDHLLPESNLTRIGRSVFAQ